MGSSEIFQQIKHLGIVPVIRTSSADAAVRAAEAICEGGIACAEITMTVGGALSALEEVAKRLQGRILLGAGTVLDPETARMCILSGAEFLVTPSLNAKTIEMAKRYSKAIFPGALTPTEILTAWEAGADAIKVFPCNAVGGAKYIRALKAPFPHIEFVPTGGVNLDTISDFLKAGCCAVGVGSELVNPATATPDGYQALVDRARQFRSKVLEARSASPP